MQRFVASAVFGAIGFLLWRLIFAFFFKRSQKVTNQQNPQIDAASGPKSSKKVRIGIFHASQSGTAVRFAQDLYFNLQNGFRNEIAMKISFPAPVSAIVSLEMLHETYNHLFFVVSTYGEGEPPDNAERFADLLKTECKSLLLSNVSFAIFGCGDSSYVEFNAFAKFVHRCILQAGAAEMLPLFCGDDCDSAIAKDFGVWKQLVLDAYRNCGFAYEAFDAQRRLIDNFIVEFVDATAACCSASTNQKTPLLPSASSPLRCCVASLQNTTDTLTYQQIFFDVPRNVPLRLAAGDHVGVVLCNPPVLVDALLMRFNLRPADCIAVVDRAANSHIFKGTVRDFFNSHFDLHRGLRLADVEYVASLVAPLSADAVRLATLRTNFDRLIAAEHLNIVDLFALLDYRPSLREVMPLFERLQPRYYSICTIADASADAKSRRISLLFKCISFTTPSGVFKSGLASSFFAQFPSHIDVFFRRSGFNLHKFVDRPLVMIGSGAGVAPFVGFVTERDSQIASLKDSKVAPAYLLFGCRTPDEFLCADVWHDAKAKGVLSDVWVAYSRAPEISTKMYVQDKMLEPGIAAILFEIVFKRRAVVYVCGNAHGMAKEVRKSWLRILETQGAMSPEAAAAFLQQMHKTKTYREDVY